MIAIPRPAAGEFAEHYAGYVAEAPTGGDALAVLTAQRDRLRDLLAGLGEDRGGYRYAPDKWSIKTVLGHISDAERVFSYRLLRIARADATPLPGFEEDDWARQAGSDQRPLADLVAEWVAVRDATTALVRGLAAEAWSRRGVASGHPVSARALYYIMLGHADHHRQVLESRYGLKASGPRPA